MLLRLLSNCMADGRLFTMGEVADVGQGVANELIALGRAEIAPEPEPVEAPVCAPTKPASRRGSNTATTKQED